MNLTLSGIAAALGFVLSLLIGVVSGGDPGVSLLRALSFGMVFFALAGVIWMFINRFLPELLSPPEEEPLMTGLETGSRVNISVGDDEPPVNAAIPQEGDSRADLGNVADLMARPRAGSSVMDSMPLSADPGRAAKGGTPAGSPPVLDLSAEDGYSGKEAPVAPAEDSGAVFTPLPPPAPLQSFSGGDSGDGIETLPDLDAMAGAFMSSDGEEGEAAGSIFGVEPKTSAPGKAKGRGDDYNPKEVASAIQTILKRD
jgi:hypothetical protein